ncbi:MAG: GDYXXLXY domain-containing protein [Beijerinckiaceae bacterium]
MTQRIRLKLAALVLLLPLLVLGGIVAKNERDIASAKTWRVKITGYDPRDLLYGHYLNFRFDWGTTLTRGSCAAEQSCCLCLDAQDGTTSPLASRKTCEAAAQCASHIPMPDGANKDAFNPEGAQRYFIPESAATQLNMLLANRQYNLQADVKIAPSGQHVLGDL